MKTLIKYESIEGAYRNYLWKVVPELMHRGDATIEMIEDGYLLDDYLDSVNLTFEDIDFS